MKETKREDGVSAEEKTQTGLGSLGPPLVIPPFAVGPSDQASWPHFTFYGSATVLSLPCSPKSPWCSWSLNASFFVPTVADVGMHADRAYVYLVRWCLQLSRGRTDYGTDGHSPEPRSAAARPYTPCCLPGSDAAELLQTPFACSACWLIPLLCRNASACCWV